MTTRTVAPEEGVATTPDNVYYVRLAVIRGLTDDSGDYEVK